MVWKTATASVDDGPQYCLCGGKHQYNYRRPAVLSDLLTVTSQVQQLNGKSGVLSQTITLEPEGQVVADALITFVCIDLKTQKALPLEGELREKLEQMVQ